MDPRIKLSWLKGSPDLKLKKKKFIEEARKYTKHVEARESAQEDSNFLSNIFKKRKISNFDSEIREYLEEDLEDGDSDPLIYWQLKQEIYPSLATMAKKHLSVPATSTPSERVFSKGRLLISHIRNRLTDKKIQAVLCLSDWIKNRIV